MAVLIASNLRKEFAGDVLFQGVSFSVGRRDRLSLAGPNGAGKTTLLRGIAGETQLDGELAFSKGTRVALHDQRPPRDLGLTLREYAFGGARDLIALEEELRRLETAMAGGTHDEATNHLDVDNLEWLERELATLDAAVVLVAHDRWFLEAGTTSVLELAPGGPQFFAGPWHEWRREKMARAAAAATTAERVAVDIARLQRFVDRFRYKESKAKQAQAKLTQIGRLQKERAAAAAEHETLTRGRRTLGFDFLQPPRSGRVVVEAEGIALSAGEKALLEDATLVLERGEKVALVGPNGSGKTTLIEAMLGRRSFDAGAARLGHGVVPGYFSQHTQELPSTGSVLDCAVARTNLPRPQAQALLGRFLFPGWETHTRDVSALSGGERRRLSLALVVASGANFLVLDEPTNHLDVESREALEAALEAFPGTVLLVSHDRALVDAVASRTLAIEDGELHSYDGGWADYVRAREARTAPLPPPPPAPPKKQKATPKPTPARPSELDRVEAEIAAREEAVSELERRLADDWSDVEPLAAHRRARDELQALLARWEELFERSQA